MLAVTLKHLSTFYETIESLYNNVLSKENTDAVKIQSNLSDIKVINIS